MHRSTLIIRPLTCLGTSRQFVDTPAAPAVRREAEEDWGRWANADCKIWHNDTNAPAGYGWQTVAFAGTWGGAYWKMGRLYQMHVCV